MTTDLLTYNGYQFNEYSHITVNATMQPDDANRTILYHRYKIRVETTIYAEEDETQGQAGEHFDRIKDRLTKQGKVLEIHHRGFGVDFLVNATATGKRDVAFGPKPMIVTWDPIGEVNAVEVVWECEVCISACNRWTGVMAINYSVVYRIDQAGYTTRTISGYLEIAMTRVGTRIPDSADRYRDKIIMPHLPSFTRETTWALSLDKRRADFAIVDSEIRSPNAFPVGVINIRGNHLAQWGRRRAAEISQNIRVSIELAQGQPRSRAIEIFRTIVAVRTQYAAARGTIFLENLFCDEELYGNTFNLGVSYRFLVQPSDSVMTALTGFFEAAAIGQPLPLNTWQQWQASIANLQSHRGSAQLNHDIRQDEIIDLCSSNFESVPIDMQRYIPPVPRRIPPLQNQRPAPNKSFIEFKTWIGFDDDVNTTVQVSMGPDDLRLSGNKFDPTKPDAALGDKDTSAQIERYVETQAGRVEITWKGYAERVGYPIQRPDKIQMGQYRFKRIGKAQFLQHFEGNVLGQPVYKAAWNQRYVLVDRPTKMTQIDGFREP